MKIAGGILLLSLSLGVGISTVYAQSNVLYAADTTSVRSDLTDNGRDSCRSGNRIQGTCTVLGATARKYTLNDCMKFAIDHNQGVKKQGYTNDSYKQDMIESIAAMTPNVSGNIGATLSYGRSIDPATNTYTTTGNLGNTYSVGASMPVFEGFSCINNLRMNRAMRLMGVNKLQQVKDELALNTMRAYFDLLYCSSEVEIAKDQLTTSKKTLFKTSKEAELGLKSEADVAQIASQVASDELLLTQQQNKMDLALLALKQQMNYPIHDSIDVETDISILNIPLAGDTLATGELIDFVLAHNPKMLASDYNVKQSKYNYYSYLGRYLPSIYIGGGYSTNYYKNLKSQIATEPFWNQFKDNRGYYFQASMSIPIFNGLSRRTNAHRYKNAYKIAQEENSETEREIQTEVAQTVMEMNGYDKEYTQATKKVDAAALSHRASLQKFDQGTMNPIELQTSANTLHQARSQQLNARLQYLVRARMINYYNGEPLVK
jgi:outer membrane protein